MKRGSVVVIPDEDQILNDKFEQDVLYGEFHVKAYQNFSDKYKLGSKFTKDESHFAALMIASMGHFNYKTEDDISLLSFYLPERITNRQLEYFSLHKFDYQKYGQIGAYTIRMMDNDFFTDEIYGLDNIEKEIIKRNKLIKEENEHVR